jgi:hypothetical protein
VTVWCFGKGVVDGETSDGGGGVSRGGGDVDIEVMMSRWSESLL